MKKEKIDDNMAAPKTDLKAREHRVWGANRWKCPTWVTEESRQRCQKCRVILGQKCYSTKKPKAREKTPRRNKNINHGADLIIKCDL